MANFNQHSPRTLLSWGAPLNRSRRMTRKSALLVLVLLLALPLFAFAQADGDEASSPKTFGPYTVTQSIELGGRVADVKGNGDVYNTFVNLHSGPRLLSQELSMRAAPGQGGLFDTLFLSSFGFGGDPNNLARLRVEKKKVYNFVALYRRDQNYWNYNLFANPLTTNGLEYAATGGKLNPYTLPWYSNSTRYQNETRQMGDAMLTLFPTSAISVRLGYAQNNNSGLFSTTLETPIQFPLVEKSGWQSWRYQAGVDIKLLPKTTLSFDQFLERDVVHTNLSPIAMLMNLGSATGPAVDFNLFSTFPPCTPAGGFLSATGIVVNSSSCTSFLVSPDGNPASAYFKRGTARTSIPTSQLALRSNYFKKLDLTADASYSRAATSVPDFLEFTHSFSPNAATGSPYAKTITKSGDFGATYHITRKLSISDKFHYLDWNTSGNAAITTYNCSATGSVNTPLTGTSLSTLASPCNGLVVGFLGGQTVSGAKASTYNYAQSISALTLLGERSYSNTATLNYQANRYISGFVGFRYVQREIRAGDAGVSSNIWYQNTSTLTTTANSTTIPTVPTVAIASGEVGSDKLSQYSGLIGLVLRPTPKWRINANGELTTADNTFVNLYPRREQRLRINSTYKLTRWASVNGSININEKKNNFAQNFEGSGLNLFPTTVPAAYGTKIHYRYYSLGFTASPVAKFSFDTNWTYMDQKMNTQTCVPVSPTSIFVGGAPPTCPAIEQGGGFPLTLKYTEKSNSLYANLTYRVMKRASVNLGYQITSTSGRNDWLRADSGQPLQVYGDIFGNAVPSNGGTFTPSSATGCNGAACVVYTGLNPNSPIGPQAVNWHAPFAGVEIGVAKNVTFKGKWMYYDYNEKGDLGVVGALGGLGPIAPRKFHANVGTLALKYSF